MVMRIRAPTLDGRRDRQVGEGDRCRTGCVEQSSFHSELTAANDWTHTPTHKHTRTEHLSPVITAVSRLDWNYFR